jgi:hypothetical protein
LTITDLENKRAHLFVDHRFAIGLEGKAQDAEAAPPKKVKYPDIVVAALLKHMIWIDGWRVYEGMPGSIGPG